MGSNPTASARRTVRPTAIAACARIGFTCRSPFAKLEDDLLPMPPRPRRPPILSRIPVWVWIAVLCAFIGWLVYKLRHAVF